MQSQEEIVLRLLCSGTSKWLIRDNRINLELFVTTGNELVYNTIFFGLGSHFNHFYWSPLIHSWPLLNPFATLNLDFFFPKTHITALIFSSWLSYSNSNGLAQTSMEISAGKGNIQRRKCHNCYSLSQLTKVIQWMNFIVFLPRVCLFTENEQNSQGSLNSSLFITQITPCFVISFLVLSLFKAFIS